MADRIEDIIGDYRAFAAQQRDRLATRGIDITPYKLSHLATGFPSGTNTYMYGDSSNVSLSQIARTSGTVAQFP